MDKRDRAAWAGLQLARLYPDPVVPLHHHDAFTLLVAVVLSAQCTDERVNRTTPALFARASTPEAMARLDEGTILEIIRPCGLGPQKSRALRELSRLLWEQHGGVVPASLDELEALPGVGHKTAQVVQVQAFGIPAFPVDTHIHRLARRWGLSSGKSVEQTERDLKRLFPRDTWGALHLRMIYYGRQQCQARTPCDASTRSCGFCQTIGAGRLRARRLKIDKPSD